MSPSAFLDCGSPPDREELVAALGMSSRWWTELVAGLASTFAPLSEHWSYSGRTRGWLLQLKQGRTTVVNLVPCRDHFVASLALSEKARRAAQAIGLSEFARSAVRDAREFPEGLGVRIEVRSRRHLADVQALAAIRMADMN